MSDLADKTIIVVDDDEAVRDSLSVLLSLAGLSVRICKSGPALLVMLESSIPDCLVVDVHMPEMSGLELVGRLKADGFAIPVILITGNLDAAIEAQAVRAGVSHLLKKPFPGSLLIETVRGILG